MIDGCIVLALFAAAAAAWWTVREVLALWRGDSSRQEYGVVIRFPKGRGGA